VGLQPGCVSVLRHASAAGVPTHVISVNWSSELVRAALQQPAAPPNSNGAVSDDPTSARFHCAADHIPATLGRIALVPVFLHRLKVAAALILRIGGQPSYLSSLTDIRCLLL